MRLKLVSPRREPPSIPRMQLGCQVMAIDSDGKVFTLDELKREGPPLVMYQTPGSTSRGAIARLLHVLAADTGEEAPAH